MLYIYKKFVLKVFNAFDIVIYNPYTYTHILYVQVHKLTFIKYKFVYMFQVRAESSFTIEIGCNVLNSYFEVQEGFL